MKLLISPGRVAETAFGRAETPVVDSITEATILSAQRKFIKPVLGSDLYRSVEEGRYPDLLENHIKPALAYYVKFLALPALEARSGQAGIVRVRSSYMEPAGDASLRSLRAQTRSEASALMREAVEYIEANGEQFPEYRPEENVLNRISVSSRIAL